MARRVKLLAVVECWPPAMLGGAELAAHALLRWLNEHGHDCRVWIRDQHAEYSWEGVPVVAAPVSGFYPDLVYTHLHVLAPTVARQIAWTERLPLVYGAHTPYQPPIDSDLVLANTAALAASYRGSARVHVLHPPVWAADYAAPRDYADSITRVGLSVAKGGHVFWQLVERMPEHRFLGVLGAWDRQLVEASRTGVEVWPTTLDMRSVYARTRILIIPSDGHETYARVGVEALASGIPVLAHPNPGVVEALGEAGIYLDRADVDSWVVALRCLDDPDEYACHSQQSLERSRQLDPDAELLQAEQVLESLAAGETDGKSRRS